MMIYKLNKNEANEIRKLALSLPLATHGGEPQKRPLSKYQDRKNKQDAT